MKFFNRGLYALILTIFFQTQLVAEYLYKDDIVNRANFAEQVETLGSELFAKTGISLRLLMLKKLPKDKTIVAYEKEILASFKTPSILLTFVENSSQVDIEVNDISLYKYFNKQHVLSPAASPVQAFLLAVVYADSWKHFNELRKDYGGTILPLIASKTKPEQLIGKYAGSMFNGYIDIAHQISVSKGIVLDNDPGETNQETIFYVKVLFYGLVLYGTVMYIRRLLYRRKHKNEQK